MKNATLEEIKEVGLDTHYAEHGKGLYPTRMRMEYHLRLCILLQQGIH